MKPAIEPCPDHGKIYGKGCACCQESRRVYQRALRRWKRDQEALQQPEVVVEVRVASPAAHDPYRRVSVVEGDLSWHEHAACANSETDVFFPSSEGRGKLMAWADALAVCDTCSVREPCLDYALRTNQRDGVWGGTTPTHRRKMKPETLVCADCWERFPFLKRDQIRCESCQERHRRREQRRWHHEVGKFRDVAS